MAHPIASAAARLRWDYTEGSPIRDRDIATQYLRLTLGVIRITDVTVVVGGGAKVVDLRERTMGDFTASVEPEIERAVATGSFRQ